MNRKTLVLPAVVGLLAPVLVACGSTESGGGDAMVVGTTDRITVGEDSPAPLDPAFAYDTGSWNVLRQTLQTLMHAPRGGGAPVPDAAQSCDFTDNASQSYRCKLRSGLKFSDGSAVTAEDVKFSIERIIGINDRNGAAALLSNVDTIEVKSEREIVFHLKTPDATFPFKLSTPAAAIVSKKKYDAAKLRDGLQVDGSGPYTMKTQAEKGDVSKVVFSRNKHYTGDIDLRNDKVELRVFPDSGAMRRALEKGEIDVATRELSAAHIKEMLDNQSKDVKLTELPGLSIQYLAFNTDHPSVKDKAVRQAMATLIDRGQIAGQVYNATAEPLYSLIPASVGAHKNAFYNKYGDPSITKARSTLRDAGISTPVEVTIHYASDRYNAKEYEVIRDQLNRSGLFKATAKGTDKWSAFRAAGQRGDYAVYGLGWVPDFPDPDNYIAPFLEKDNFLGSPYVSAEARKLIPQSRRQADRTAAAETFARLQQIVAEDVPVLPLWQGKQYVASRKGINGVERLLNGSSDLQLWELDNSGN
ncbi:ABC transporter substrate-binding protein [Streptomyces clavuligerus]|nr:ABC transporter substrate-binding protein [Streptomyces clavuligerus]ANW20984.1 peptide-binding protein [Streptomyces clavuligerus]AXU15602.1 peptide-binding protein [Streptomyces clavuligerus]MBY6305713.1 peptide-binding protein [Streptomyces clavuligerus]QCS08381.1 peptide-binding protein [Streptomyces clavuligerus]QPJ92286.1 peptide-binding protein [Streptomyces clavuligerus]